MTQNYQLKENQVIRIPIIRNLISNGLGKEVIAKLNERFKGVKNIEYTQKHKKDEPISYSNVPRALSINSILRQITNGNIRILSYKDVVRYWDSIPDISSTYADTDSIVIYPNSGPNEDLRQKALSLMGKDSKLPLIASGLDVERADNGYGFTFKGTDYMRSVEAPFLGNDGKLAYDPSKDELVSSYEGVSIWTPNDQSGLRRLCRDWYDVLDARDGSLLGASVAGRVQLISGEATSKNFESYIAQFKAEEAKTKERLVRIQRAQAILMGE